MEVSNKSIEFILRVHECDVEVLIDALTSYADTVHSTATLVECVDEFLALPFAAREPWVGNAKTRAVEKVEAERALRNRTDAMRDHAIDAMRNAYPNLAKEWAWTTSTPPLTQAPRTSDADLRLHRPRSYVKKLLGI